MRLPYPSLCLVTDRLRCNGRSVEHVIDAAIDGGVNIVQLREKDLPAAELYSLALRVKAVVGVRALLLVNDRLDVALAADVDGVQLGESALPVEAARRLAGDNFLLGRSVHSVSGALEAESQGADILTLGTIFPTASHPGIRTGGSELVREVASAVSVPFLGIGGIDASNAGQVMKEGAAGVAVISAISTAQDPALAATEVCKAMCPAVVPEAVRES